MDDLDSSRTNLRNTLAVVSQRIRRLVKETPGLDSEIKDTTWLIKMCQGRDDHIGFVPMSSPHPTIHSGPITIPSVISFDSRFSLC